MKNECRDYARSVAEEIDAMYNDEKMSLYDYVAQALDYSAIVSSTKTVEFVRLYVTLGGPTCYVDTELRAVVCAWGGDKGEYPLDWGACNELESIIAEYMELDR